MTLIREGGCRRGACSECLWSSACSSSSSKALDTGQDWDWDQVLGKLVRGARPKPTRGTGIDTERVRGCAYPASSTSWWGANCWIFTASPRSRQGRQLELLMGGMALPLVWSEMRAGILLLLALSLLSASLVGAGQDPGTVIPAESR